jgi:hypothetical protein
MVRTRFHLVIDRGRFNEGAQWARELNEARRTAGCAEGFRRGREFRAPEHWPWSELLIEAPTLA